MEHIVHVDEMAETIISEPSEKGARVKKKGQEYNISWLGTCHWGLRRGVTVKYVQYEEFMVIIKSQLKDWLFLQSWYRMYSQYYMKTPKSMHPCDV